MALVALASVKGAPGVTTAALVLGASWPVDRAVVVAELDPAGGDIGARHGLPVEPSVVTLAAAVRRTRTHAVLIDHCQELAGGLRVLVGSPAPTEMRSAIDLIVSDLPALACASETDVIVDCGRLESSTTRVSGSDAETAQGSSLRRVLARSDVVLLVSRAQLADLSHVEAWLPALRSLNDHVALLLVGPLRWRAEEIESELGVDVRGHLPQDPAAADLVGGRPGRRGALARLPLIRAGSGIARSITAHLPVAATVMTELTGRAGSFDAVVPAEGPA